MQPPSIRPARPSDRATIRHIETLAAARFDAADLPSHLRGETLDPRIVDTAIGDGLLWMSEDAGFLAAQIADNRYLHVLEMSVLPTHGQRGIGTALMQTAMQAAMERGLNSLTLTTFGHVPWNAPFYARLGFMPLEHVECPPHLQRCLDEETEAGLLHRVAMMAPAR